MVGDTAAQVAQFPEWLQWWLRWMQAWLILLPVLFLRHREARWLLAAQAANFAIGAAVFLWWDDGWVTRLFGLGHVFWAVFYVWIIREWRADRLRLAERPWFAAWLGGAMLTLSVSLPIDAVDIVRYAIGERYPMVEYFSGS